jgi:RNAse (barnase) inhibitor barstar
MLRLEDLLRVGDPSVHFASPAEIAPLQNPEVFRGALRELDGRAIADESALLASLGKALDFPDYYGENWDAFEECLRDIGEFRPEGCVLVLRHARGLWNHLPRVLGLLVAIWLATVELLIPDGVPLHLVFVLDHAKTALPE